MHLIRESQWWMGQKGNSRTTGYATGISKKERGSSTSEMNKLVDIFYKDFLAIFLLLFFLN